MNSSEKFKLVSFGVGRFLKWNKFYKSQRDDLMQVAWCALLEAEKSFDPNRGMKLSSWILTKINYALFEFHKDSLRHNSNGVGDWNAQFNEKKLEEESLDESPPPDMIADFNKLIGPLMHTLRASFPGQMYAARLLNPDMTIPQLVAFIGTPYSKSWGSRMLAKGEQIFQSYMAALW